MVIPMVPIAALVAIAGGSYTLAWYNSLSRKKQEELNKSVITLCKRWFGRPPDKLTPSQAERVLDKTRTESES